MEDYIGHYSRIKDKYKKNGFDGWHDYEILELVLTYVIRRKDTKPIAKQLIKKFKTVNRVLEATEEELKSIKGVGTNTCIFFKMLKDITSLYLKDSLFDKDIVSSPKCAYDYLKVSLKTYRDEQFVMLFLNSANKLISVETIHSGVVNKSVVYPRKVVEKALKYNAVSAIAAHNHPGGTLEPSEDDKRITNILKTALNSVDISLLDHIIVSKNGYFSFKEKGLI